MKFSLLRGLRAVISFLTILPVGNASIDEMSANAYLFPIVGCLIGTISGVLGVLLFFYLPHALAGTITLILLLSLTGFNQLDGVLDLGDALMFRGANDDRINILHDKSHGVGGITSLYFLLSMTLVTVILIGESIAPALIIAETCGKFSMLIGGCFGKPHVKGIGRIFILNVKKNATRNLIIGTTISAVIALLLSDYIFTLIVLFIVWLFSIVWVIYFNEKFGCTTGDMLGSMSEVSRLICLTLFLITGVM